MISCHWAFIDFKDTLGSSGNYQKEFKVYLQEGLRCKTIGCTDTIQKKIVSNRSTFFCNSCQNQPNIQLTVFSSQAIPLRMANTKSAIKRIRRISKQTAVNKARKSRFRNALKKMNALIDTKKKNEALKFLPKLNSELMKIAKTGVIKKQNASRNVSRITKKIAAI